MKMGMRSSLPVSPESDLQPTSSQDGIREMAHHGVSFKDGGIVKRQPSTPLDSLDYMGSPLSIIVVGASGDLAKKKTYPSLYELYRYGYLPEHVIVMGYARSGKSDVDFRDHLRPFLAKSGGDSEQLDAFLSRCYYRSGAYDDAESFAKLNGDLSSMEVAERRAGPVNRLFYFAIPPNVFLDVARSIKLAASSPSGWTRLVVEKPFGHDYDSCETLSRGLAELWSEEHLYRIDHYLGKEMVQNLMVLRFGNGFLEPLWNRNHIQCVLITFKEDFGTQGRGGYFDQSGIIRDILQNHLTQVFSLVAMEPPVKVSGADHSNYVRDAKVAVLDCTETVKLDDVVLGQYVSNGKEPGYLDDPTVSRGSRTPTFCSAVLRINNPRWDGVPFILKAGKALDDRKAEIRIQFRPAPASTFMFDGQHCPPNELVIRLQPKEAVYLKCNLKAPGLRNAPTQAELDLSYHLRFPDSYNPDAYTRLILDILRGQQSTFVRDDELRASWRIWTPLLKTIDHGEAVPIPYPYGSRGPPEADAIARKHGFEYSGRYKWVAPSPAGKM